MLLVGVDVGGTHTDLYAWDDGAVQHAKVPSTPSDPADGVLDALARIDRPLSAVDHFLHGSTIATNALIEGTYPETAFVTTEGFRDVVEIGRYHREHLYDPYQQKPDPLVPRRHRFTVPERMGADGTPTTPLDETAVETVAATLRDGPFESVAVGFVNAYANDVHERRAADILREQTDLDVVTSAAVSPTLGTLERFTTAIVNAALSPLIGSYHGRLEARLADRGFDGTFSVITSNGGVMRAASAARHAETLVLSGPAAGATGAGLVGEAVGGGDVIGMDMGGTSTDVSLVEDGDPLVTTEYEVAFDVPLSVPMVDVKTIGSGGGTIAWVDSGGSLRVGPRSAGADPGPACYPDGGDQPTITDANLVLGRLNPDNFLGGDQRLDVDAAREAVGRLGDRVGLGPVETATGILRIATENMAAAIREATIERGRDPREYHLVGFGGCGPMHVVDVAASLGVPSVVVPGHPGVLSAMAGTMMDVTYDAETSFYAAAAAVDADALSEALADLDAQVRDRLAAEGLGGDAVSLARVAEMRYVGQTYELAVSLPGGSLDAADVEAAVERFHDVHEAEYGVSNESFAVEVVALRVRGTGAFADADLARAEVVPDPPDPTTREVFFDGTWHETTIYDRRHLAPGTTLTTPAVVEDETATAVVGPDTSASVDETGALRVEVAR